MALSICQALTDLVGDSGLDEAPEGHGSSVGHTLILRYLETWTNISED